MRTSPVFPGTAALLLAIAAALLLAAPIAAADPEPTPAPTAITTDTSWAGRVLVGAPTTVSPGATLRVAAGTTVFFRADAGLTVNGVLRAEGTPEQPVTFVSEDDGAWSGIVLVNGGDPSLLRNCRVLGARTVTVGAGEHVVERSEISGGAVGIEVSGDQARPVLRANRILDAREGGIRCVGGSAPLIEENVIERCGPFGIHASQSAVPLVRRNSVASCATGIEVMQAAPLVRENRVRECERGIALTSAGGGKPVQGNAVESCGTGILVQQYSRAEILGNTVARNKDGIVCFMGSSPLIRGNVIEDNETGVLCVQLANAELRDNLIAGNRRGVLLQTSSYATIHGNNIVGNTVQLELGSMMSADWEKRAGNKPRRGLQQQSEERTRRTGVAPPGAPAGDGAAIGGFVDATGNWWGEETTREMEAKGPDADIAGLIDAFDVPQRNYDGYEGTYAQDRIRYAPWERASIPAAGLPKEPASTP